MLNFLGKLWGRPPQLRIKMESKQSPLWGEIYKPIAVVQLWAASESSWKQVQMLVDTGADLTILPGYLAVLLGIDLNRETRLISTQGIGGEQQLHLYPELKIKVGEFARTIPVGFTSSNHVPPLMGRQLCLETFQLEFDHRSWLIFKA